MFITRNRVVRIVTPLALAGALVLTGCSSSSSSTATEAEADTIVVDTVDEEVETEGEAPYTDNFYASDAGLNEALEALSKRLGEVTPDLAGVGVSIYGDLTTVDIAVVVHDENETPAIPAADLRAILDELAAFSYDGPQQVTEWSLDGWDAFGWSVPIASTAAELGIDAAYIDADWDNLVIPADAIGTV